MAYDTGGSEQGPQIDTFVNWKAFAVGGALGKIGAYLTVILAGGVTGWGLYEIFEPE